jgi:hypothetical protein
MRLLSDGMRGSAFADALARSDFSPSVTQQLIGEDLHIDVPSAEEDARATGVSPSAIQRVAGGGQFLSVMQPGGMAPGDIQVPPAEGNGFLTFSGPPGMIGGGGDVGPTVEGEMYEPVQPATGLRRFLVPALLAAGVGGAVYWFFVRKGK